jgi:hypothetical protein
MHISVLSMAFLLLSSECTFLFSCIGIQHEIFSSSAHFSFCETMPDVFHEAHDLGRFFPDPSC